MNNQSKCPICGSDKFRRETDSGYVKMPGQLPQYQIERPVEVTQIICVKCGLIVDDDCHSSVAEAYAHLFKSVGKKPTITLPTDIISKANSLSGSTKEEVQKGFDHVQDSWSAHKVIFLRNDELEPAIKKIIQGNAAEAFLQVSNKVRENKVLEIVSVNEHSHGRMCCIYKVPNEMFALYGHVSLYRLIREPGSSNDLNERNRPGKTEKKWWQFWK